MIKSYIIPVFLSKIYMRIKCKIFLKSKKIFVFLKEIYKKFRILKTRGRNKKI